ncbi:hypothetical protein JTB14_000884 [Gonioctena quinquepunctata]|nr:hypothetical protein JTB14_000884 [Gonioctena quinquepunctata]
MSGNYSLKRHLTLTTAEKDPAHQKWDEEKDSLRFLNIQEVFRSVMLWEKNLHSKQWKYILTFIRKPIKFDQRMKRTPHSSTLRRK